MNNIPVLDERARALAVARQRQLTKPTGALGRLEQLSLDVAAMQGRALPQCEQVAVIIFAGDHGVAVHGVSAYPQAVTAHMCMNFCHGGAAINVLARQASAQLRVVDVGVAAALPVHPQLIAAKVALGTADFTTTVAMSVQQCAQAIGVGQTQVAALIDEGAQLVVFGEMGIGNTTSASALMVAFTGLPITHCCGRGTGIDDETLSKKCQVVQAGIERHAHNHNDPLTLLAALGGLEIAAMVGGMFTAAQRRVPIMVDGFISSVAALTAIQLQPAVKDYMIWSHRSAEGPHAVLLDFLAVKPLLALEMRLGEGSGGILAIHLVRAACRTLQEMATFADAGVANKSDVAASAQAP